MKEPPYHGPLYYILNDKHEPVPVKSVVEWGDWMGWGTKDGGYLVALDHLFVNGQKVDVSTVFLGIDHSFGLSGPPVLFETMVFGGPKDHQYQRRYTTWDAAVKGHAQVVGVAKAAALPFKEWKMPSLGATNWQATNWQKEWTEEAVKWFEKLPPGIGQPVAMEDEVDNDDEDEEDGEEYDGGDVDDTYTDWCTCETCQAEKAGT